MKAFLSCRRLVANQSVPSHTCTSTVSKAPSTALVTFLSAAGSSRREASSCASTVIVTDAKRFFMFSPSQKTLQQSLGTAEATGVSAAAATTPHSAAAAMYKSSRSNRQRGGGLPSSNKGGGSVGSTTTTSAAAAVSGVSPASSSSPSSPFGRTTATSGVRSALDVDSKAAAALNCDQESAPEKRPLSALQKRQLAMKDKKVFKLTSRAVDRVNLLLNLHNDRITAPNSSGDNAKRAVGIRIGVKKKGCSGYSYTVNYEFDAEKLKLKTGGDALVDAMINGSRAPPTPTQGATTGTSSSSSSGKISLMGNSPLASSSAPAPFTPSDVHVDQDGVHIFVEGSALFYVIGTVMDYTVSNVEEKFTFQNPNQAHSCGCGESFMPFGV